MTERAPVAGGAGPGGGAPGGPPGTGGTAWIERWFLRAALGVGAAAWLGLLLAEMGLLDVRLLLAVSAVGAAALAAYARSARRSPSGPPPPAVGRGGLAAFCAVAVGAGFLFLPPYEAAVDGGDATVYLNLSRKIAETGALVFDDPLLRDLSVEAREELFLNRQPGDSGYGRYARFPGGFVIPEIAEPEVTSGFSPLFPVLAALFQQVSPPRGALFVAPLFGVLSVAGLFLVAAHLGGVRTGLLAAALAAAALPQIWFAKYPVPETVAQFFVTAGLLALLAAFRSDRPRLAAAAGGFFGLACFAKIDLVVLLSVALAAFVAWRLLARPGGGGRCVVFLLAAFGLGLAHNVAHYALYPSDYTLWVRQQLDRVPLFPGLAAAALTAVLLAAAGAALLAAGGRWRRLGPAAPRAAGWGLAGLVAAYAAVYAAAFSGRWPDPLFWLSWYLSWPVLGLCAVGLLWLLWSGRAGRADPGLSFLLILTGVVSLSYLYNPLEPGEHIWSMRRFVPVVLPGLLTVVALGAGRLVEWVYFEFRTVATAALAAVLVGLVGAASAPVLGERLWAGVLDQSAAVARTFPEDAAVLAGPGLAGTHVHTSLTYLHGVDTVLVQQDEPGHVLRDVVLGWLAAGRPVFAVIGGRGFSLPAPELAAAEIGRASIDLRTLERTRGREPRDLVDVSIELGVLRLVREDASTAGRVTDVGDAADDLVAGLRGFHGAERDGDGRSFRWTGDAASLAVAGGDRVALEVAGSRPPAAPPAEISVWAGPHRIADGLAVGNGRQTIALDLPASEGAGTTELTIRSNAFRPVALDISPDRRSLGIRVYRVEVLRDPPDGPPSAPPPPDVTP